MYYPSYPNLSFRVRQKYIFVFLVLLALRFATARALRACEFILITLESETIWLGLVGHKWYLLIDLAQTHYRPKKGHFIFIFITLSSFTIN